MAFQILQTGLFEVGHGPEFNDWSVLISLCLSSVEPAHEDEAPVHSVHPPHGAQVPVIFVVIAVSPGSQRAAGSITELLPPADLQVPPRQVRRARLQADVYVGGVTGGCLRSSGPAA